MLKKIVNFGKGLEALFQLLLAPFLKGSKNSWERDFFQKKKYL
jgi:hypothetical protein